MDQPRNTTYTKIGIAIAVVLIIAAISAGVYFSLKKEKYAEKKAVVVQQPVKRSIYDDLRPENPVDSRDERLVYANKCDSYYAGAFGMGAETNCGRVKTNPNMF